MTAPRWIGLAGPTASGKSAIALALAEWVALEIVSVDSALVYRGMDIGTAKPSAAERAAVAHHLIDLIDPRDAYSAAQFATDATRLIGEIEARGKLPLLVGGTMLYFKILSDGLDALPAAAPALRAQIEAQAFARGWPAMHDELARIDPASAARLPPNDAQRIGRAIEVFRISGRTLSSFHTAPRSAQPAALIALEPQSRAWLHERIAARFETMLTAGFLDEVRALRSRRELHAELPSMRCVGYRQAWAALDEGLSGTALIDAVRERGIAATRQLAKRQLTWLRGMQREVVACDGDAVLDQVAALVTQWQGP
jgi:tRNA dimethylallyltransferase